MALRRHRPDEAAADKWLEVDASMTGTLTFKDPVNLQINGRFEGTLETKGNLSIGERAEVKATIKGESVTVAGAVTGTIIATSRLELLPTARLTGKAASPRVLMHEGAVLQGSLDMSRDSGEAPWMTVEELARYLEVEPSTVADWAQSGRLPGQRDNGQWRFERTKVEEWLSREKVK